MNGIEISNVGNLGSDIDLRYSQSGTPWASFSIAVRELQTIRGERKEITTWLRCKVFGELAENAAESLKKGARVMFSGKLRSEEWTPEGGEKRSVMSLIIDEIGPSLRFAQAKVTRTERSDNGQQGSYSNSRPSSSGGSFGSGSSQDTDPWSGNSGGGYRGATDPFAADDPFSDEANPFG